MNELYHNKEKKKNKKKKGSYWRWWRWRWWWKYARKLQWRHIYWLWNVKWREKEIFAMRYMLSSYSNTTPTHTSAIFGWMLNTRHSSLDKWKWKIIFHFLWWKCKSVEMRWKYSLVPLLFKKIRSIFFIKNFSFLLNESTKIGKSFSVA